ncbi:Ig-like domain-containing protein [Nocardioides sp. TRM66260-LWL]|uniref:Ig-like domain-containing protein n=1 Tax=Nocardioides sp. TRM66260-LWL TaxID=2874478 RepID=UPI001CC7FD45|nr:Ig-like domain-containing protein [Nocardioides sp. TRM66260-LWL]MBZ5734725.1 Ig-like domain-containing protein [Nocardioides sp. TRM66260-LWL]
MKLNRTLALTCATAAAASGIAVVAAGSAEAAPAPYRILTVSPASSATLAQALEFDSNATCGSLGATNSKVTLSGPALSAPANILGNNDTNGITSTHFVGQKTFKQIFSAIGVNAPSGAYTVTAVCQNADGTTVFGTFVGKVTFTPNNAGSDSAFSSSVGDPATETSVDAIAGGPFTYGDSVTLSASVAAAANGPVNGGTVQFKVDGNALDVAQPVVNGAASLTTTAITAGDHSITADYLPGTAKFGASSSVNNRAITIAKKSTSLTLTDNGDTAQYADAVFTAKVAAGIAGSVDFYIDGTKVATKAVDGTGTSVYSDKTLDKGTRVVRAVFTPTDANVTGSEATINHTVTEALSKPAFETLSVEVQPGSLTISIADPDPLSAAGDGQVKLSDPVIDQTGSKFVSTGSIDPITVTDTRAGDKGWTAQASVSDFVYAKDKTVKISGYDLGFKPKKVSAADHQNLTLGSKVDPALVLAGAKPSDASLGLYDARTFASAPAKAGTGTAKLAADLLLQVPTELPPGLYTATLTFTVS